MGTRWVWGAEGGVLVGRWAGAGEVCVGWGLVGDWVWNHSSENGSAVKEGPDCVGTACEREQHVQPNQSHIRKKVLLSASNGPLDNHTGTNLCYLTLIAITPAPLFPPSPFPPPSQNPMAPRDLAATSQLIQPDPFLNGIHNHTLIYFSVNCYRDSYSVHYAFSGGEMSAWFDVFIVKQQWPTCWSSSEITDAESSVFFTKVSDWH